MAKPRLHNFSIIIPTWTGEVHINACFKSILAQEPKQDGYEVVVIIDGPNKNLRKVVDEAAAAFRSRNINFTVHQFAQNKGRFHARYKGAEIASCSQLLFVDDRVTLNRRFMQALATAKTDLLMPNVLESSQPNMLSRLNYLLRRRIYGKKKWGGGFESYYVTEANFENVPKGTAGFWVPKGIFIDACQHVEATAGSDDNLRNSSDDTKLLREIVKEKQILKSNATVIYYNPRAKLTEEAYHLYRRGPKFVDYYLRKGSRFRPYLLGGTVGTLIAIVGIILWHWLFVLGLVGATIITLVGLSLVLMEKSRDLWVVWVGLPLAVLLFGAGVVRGVSAKMYRLLIQRYN